MCRYIAPLVEEEVSHDELLEGLSWQSQERKAKNSKRFLRMMKCSNKCRKTRRLPGIYLRQVFREEFDDSILWARCHYPIGCAASWLTSRELKVKNSKILPRKTKFLGTFKKVLAHN